MMPSHTWVNRLAETGYQRRAVIQNALYGRFPADYILQRLELNPEGARRELGTAVELILAERGELLSASEKRDLTEAVVAEVTGYGPLTRYIEDPLCSEIMVNGPHSVWIERAQRLQFTDARFADEQHVLRILRRILDPIGRRIDQSSPIVNARLPDGSRLNAVMAPQASPGPAVTIRKFRERPFTMADLIQSNTLTPQAARFLIACVRGRRNIVVSGNTGSGKTTLLNVLSEHIRPSERVITIEDPRELRLGLPHIVSLEAQPANQEGAGGVTVRDHVINALRMRPDRIVVGEVRDGAALDMLQAMSTGHDGSLTTVHANSATEVVSSRLETLALLADVDLPSRAIRAQIACAIHVIVHQARLIALDDTIKRKVVSIVAVKGMAGDAVDLQELFRLCPSNAPGSDGFELRYTGERPPWLAELGLAEIA